MAKTFFSLPNPSSQNKKHWVLRKNILNFLLATKKIVEQFCYFLFTKPTSSLTNARYLNCYVFDLFQVSKECEQLLNEYHVNFEMKTDCFLRVGIIWAEDVQHLLASFRFGVSFSIMFLTKAEEWQETESLFRNPGTKHHSPSGVLIRMVPIKIYEVILDSIWVT